MDALVKDILREIRGTLGRFLSLVVISALGAAIVVGIQAAAENMRAGADDLLRARQVYDVAVTAPRGLSDGAAAALADLPGVREAVPAGQVEAFVAGGDGLVVRAHELPAADGINQARAVTGTLPGSAQEVAVEPALLELLGLGIGDQLGLTLADDPFADPAPGEAAPGDAAAETPPAEAAGTEAPAEGHAPAEGAPPPSDDPVLDALLTQSTFTITGTVDSPLYLSLARGQTALGEGHVGAYVVLHPDAFRPPARTVAYLLMEGSDELDQMSDAYWDAGAGWQREVQGAAQGLVEEGAAEGPLLVAARRDGGAFFSYFQDTLRLERIGRVFPLVFYVVAIMVSLTTMSRMVEEHRGQVGVYRALGYGRAATMAKFVVYGLLASVLGGVLGVLAGSLLLPRVVTDAYAHLYTLAQPPTPIHWGLGALALGAAVACVLAATVVTGIGTTRSTPATLMRPKPPAAGQRVLLERVGFLWRRMGFLAKVAYRNVFRYKVRTAMTVVGTAACCALLLTAFGLRDSIGAVGERQFSEITTYAARVHLGDDATDAERASLVDALPAPVALVREEATTAQAGSRTAPLQVVAPARADALDGLVVLPDARTGQPRQLADDDVLLTDRAAGLLGVREGSDVTLLSPAGTARTLRITGVVQNYVEHYLYVGPAAQARAFGEAAVPNAVLLGELDDTTLRELRAHPAVVAVVSTDDVRAGLAESTDAMGVVTWVLILLAGALAFVVLFNLATITMTERHRELATIKVLGMNTGELSMYVFRENGALTVVGIAVGLVAGIFLHRFVLDSAQVDIVKFPELINPGSYLLAAVLTAAFAAVVNLAMIPRLRSINMVESLKSVE